MTWYLKSFDVYANWFILFIFPYILWWSLSAKTSHSLYLFWFSFLVSQIWCIIQVVCILKERVTAFLCATFLWKNFQRFHRSFWSWASKSVLAVIQQFIEAFALPTDQSRVRDHGLIRWYYGSKTSNPPHVLTRCDTYKLSLAIRRHHAGVERFWRILHLHF